MKKILLTLATLALSASAVFAAEMPATGATFYVPGQQEITDMDDTYLIYNMNSEVTVTLTNFDAELGYMPFIMYSNGAGFAIAEPMPADVEYVNADECIVTLTDATWGNPYMGNYYCTLMMAFLNEEGDMFVIDDEPLFYQVAYTTPNIKPATLVSVYPDNDWSEETFAQAYANGEIRFNFSNALTIDENDPLIGRISYTRFDGTRVRPVDIELGDNAEAGWNYMDGCFTISVNYALADVAANEISTITVSLDKFESPFGSVTVEAVTLVNNNLNVQRIAKKALASKDFAVSNETVSVYNVAGILVKENIAQSEVNALPKGLYIVNGKKVVVK